MPEREPEGQPETGAAARVVALEETVAQQRSELELLERQLVDALTDSVTGLRRREGLYRTYDAELTAILGPEVRAALEGAADDAEALRALDRVDADALAAAPCAVLMGDVAYLSFVNLSGHEAGDTLLRALGDAARAMGSPSVTAELPGRATIHPEATFYRHGGDEISAFLRSDRARAEAIAAEYQLKVRAHEFDALRRHGLATNVDIAVAHVSEGVEALRWLLRDGVGILPDARAQKIIDLTVAIADMRVSIRKGVDRVRELMRLRRSQPVDAYARIAAAIRKGAYGMDDATIDALLREEDAGADVGERIAGAVLARIDVAFFEAQRGREREFSIVKTLAAPRR